MFSWEQVSARLSTAAVWSTEIGAEAEDALIHTHTHAGRHLSGTGNTWRYPSTLLFWDMDVADNGREDKVLMLEIIAGNSSRSSSTQAAGQKFILTIS